MRTANGNILEIRHITKDYPGVRALDDVCLDIKEGFVHCIVGENGAGKSTLVKILTGAESRSSGKILFGGLEYNPKNTREAIKAGMSTLFQELNIVEGLTVGENLTLGREHTTLGVIRHSQDEHRAIDLLRTIAPDITVTNMVSELSVAKKQMLEITKAVAADARVIIMDEPTAAITQDEVEKLFGIIKELRQHGVTVIYISHRLNEIFAIGDYVTALRDGRVVDTKRVSEIESRSELIKMITGKVVIESYVPSQIDHQAKALQVKGLTTQKLRSVSFDLFKGEILGFYGLVGSGKTEIARALFGVDPKQGETLIHGRELLCNAPRQAIRNGIAMLPEERRTEGLCPILPIRENIPLMDIRKIVSAFGVTSTTKERGLARKFMKLLRIAARDEDHVVAQLSGGNQQKVVLAKCLNAESTILLLDEPTRGVDVGAKDEIHTIIRDLSSQGVSTVVFSSDLPEILNLCDRIMLLFEGAIRAEIKNGPDVDAEYIMHIVTGGDHVHQECA